MATMPKQASAESAVKGRQQQTNAAAGPGPGPPHPRRPLAQHSVSLRPTPADSAKEPGSQQTSNSSSSLLAHRNSSGETSNAENWFERSNKNTSNNNKPTFDDSDSPFNFENDDSPMPPPNYAQQLLPIRQPMLPDHSSGSSSEEYRSVIDDLTIENKRLKKRLKKYEKSQDSPMAKDKLFEVRIHGLAPEKKRELEETLLKFASGLDPSPSSGNAHSSSAISGQSRSGNVKMHPGSSLSSLAAPRVADSGYGSMTTTGKNSTPHSGLGAQSNPAEASQTKDTTIRSYLHDIPEGLMPRHPTAMTEKSKKKLVVRRLEQIFSGRVADPNFGQQPLQQQEVSKSAAKDEANALKATGGMPNPEGMREAYIMESEAEEPPAVQSALESTPMATESGTISPALQHEKSTTGIESDRNTRSSMSPPAEQRPTRPLDLDPHRAQDPKENLEYFRHLGFLNPSSATSRPMFDTEEWIYLNLLVNMAQLHTINVTNDFIKDAIAEHSKKLELSGDGRKVIWKGGTQRGKSASVSPAAMDTDSSSSSSAQALTADGKRTRPPHLGEGQDSSHQTKKQALDSRSNEKFAYRPIIPSNKIQENSDEDDSDSDVSMAEADESPSQLGATATGGSSGRNGSVKRSTPVHKKTEDGPIIFYNKATFCTDLSGDASGLKRVRRPIEYHAVTASPLGAEQKKEYSRKGNSRGSTRGSVKGSVRGSTKDSARGSRKGSVIGSERGVFDVSELSSSIGSLSPRRFSLKFPSAEASPKRVTFAEDTIPIPLEASGIGGVIPHDNIAITVKRQYAGASGGARTNILPVNSKLDAVLASRSRPKEAGVRERIIATHERNLDPSPLPPASLHFDADDAKSDSDSLDVAQFSDDGDNEEQDSEEAMVSVTLGRRANSSSAESDSGEDDDESEDDENSTDDQSLDFLATARAVDPEAIRAKEREYDAEMAERLAEEIPAGSSAATAGGGSGFNSPEVTMPSAAGLGDRSKLGTSS